LHVASLHIYPIKSCAGISLTSVELDSRGFQYDRQWMLISSDQGFLTQRQQPKMAMIKPHLTQTHLILNAAGMSPISLSLESNPAKKRELTRVWNTDVMSSDQGNAVAAWFCHYLELQNVRLVRMCEDSDTSFVDSKPILVISEASLDDLNRRLPNAIPIDRFRPNIVIAHGKPYQEDNCQQIHIGNLILESSKPCTRCIITATDQQTGKKKGKEPLKTLSTYRKSSGGVTFGYYFIPQGSGQISLNDRCQMVPI
jgi:uncharacterized protein